MTRLRRAIGALRPRSYRARIAVALALALAVAIVGMQFAFRTLVVDRLNDSVSANLRQQAQAVALEVQQLNVPAAIDAARYLPDTSILVKEGNIVVWWNGQVVHHLDSRASARAGDWEVTLEREAKAGVLASWVLPSLLALGLVAACALVWLVSGRLARRLTRDVGRLARTAKAVAEGDLGARAPVTDDELGRLGAALNRMAERLAAAEARQRAFLADVAHELRTPVTAIEGFASALADGTARRPDDREEAAAFIRDEAARLRVLIRDLQELTWLDLDPPVDRRAVDLAQLGREAVARLAADAAARGVRLEAPEGCVEGVTDPSHVATILANLLTNALKATPPGGRVGVSIARAGPDALIVVRDTGVGIRPEHLPYLFERLYRVAPGRERDDDGGSGLGLSIVRRLAELLGGYVSVASEPGRGSAFTVRLPAAGPAKEPARPEPTAVRS
jgi:signal transduction histidine kinase